MFKKIFFDDEQKFRAYLKQKLIYFVLALIFSSPSLAADTPQLALWITDSIGATDGSFCKLSPSLASQVIAGIAPTLTENEVLAWQSATGLWELNHDRNSGDQAAQQLQNHCFVLAVDGKVISAGSVLSAHSARLVLFPTLLVHNRNGVLSLQLKAAHSDRRDKLIHVELLDTVFATKERLNQ